MYIYIYCVYIGVSVIINFGSDHDDMVGLTRVYFRC